MNKKLMDLLKILPVDILRASEGYINKTVDEVYTQAHDQIIELWKECLPKKFTGKLAPTRRAYNQAITQAEKNMEE